MQANLGLLPPPGPGKAQRTSQGHPRTVFKAGVTTTPPEEYSSRSSSTQGAAARFATPNRLPARVADRSARLRRSSRCDQEDRLLKMRKASRGRRPAEGRAQALRQARPVEQVPLKDDCMAVG
jgi:hypothetical protein